MSRTEKARLNQLVRHRTGIHLNGLAGLYCYFLCLAHEWMAQDALAGWLIPSEFMDVNYGVQLKEYLLRKVTLLQVHRFDSHDVQFDDALVSSSIVWFRKSPCPPKHPILFTYGPHLAAPEITRTLFVEDVSVHSKWTRIAREPDISPSHHSSNTNQIRLGDLFTVRRGLATGANEFFILTEQQVHEYNLPPRFLQPILPSPRYLPLDEVAGDDLGVPLIQRRLFLLRCNAPEEMVHSEYPDLWAYLQRGRKQGIHNRYLCAHRSPWYLQEDRPPTPFLCTYMGRADTSKGTPFRFILNHSQATAPNVYLLLYPRPSLQKVLVQQPRLLIEVWEALNKLPLCSLTSEGRVYGGGLYKMEPRELSNVPADDVMQIIRQNDEFIHFRQQRLFEKRLGDQYILRE